MVHPHSEVPVQVSQNKGNNKWSSELPLSGLKRGLAGRPFVMFPVQPCNRTTSKPATKKQCWTYMDTQYQGQMTDW